MAYLDRQKDSFASSLSAAAAKISVKKGAAAAAVATATPASPTPSVESATSVSGLTPKKAKGGATSAPSSGGGGGNTLVYSQPENTGVGAALGTNIVYALDYLKQQGGRPVTLAAVLGHLSLDREPEAFKKQVVARLRHHPRIVWALSEAERQAAVAGASAEGSDKKLVDAADWRAGTYAHNPLIPHVKDRTALLRYLQRRPDAQGVLVKDLKDGWPDCAGTIAALEREHRVLVVRTKKDNHPRMVWLDDPTLCHAVEPEFQALWHRVDVPSTEDIVRKLAAAGQKPTSDDPRLLRDQAAPREKKQKKRAQRRTGKSTNTHMEHLLKDYSGMKR